MKRLDLSNLAALPSSLRPRFDPGALRRGIVHLGIGAFHRAHQAIYTDDALTEEWGAWGICGVSLRSAEARDRLVPQDGLYTAVEHSPARTRRRVIGSVREVLYLGDDRALVGARLADPATRIVSLTVTEKGYCHDPASGHLDFDHPDIAHDLAHADGRRSAVGIITAALEARREAGHKAFTIVCCDNLPHNGALLQGLTHEFAEASDPALARWIAGHASFPSTMVDRIVPATTGRDVAANDEALGMHDAAPVVFEPFRQWVIEDRFVDGRPAWHRAGAEFVADVAPYEAMKLRLLNGSHSALAYLGFLAGHDYIYQVAARPEFVALMRGLMAEAAPTLAVGPSVDVPAYCNALVTRFANPALPHRTQQIAMDGSQKLPQRLLGTVRDNRKAGRPYAHLALAIAGWMRYVAGTDEAGRKIDVSDPLAATFAELGAAHRGNARALAGALIGVEAVFGRDLREDPGFVDAVTKALAMLYHKGAAMTVLEGMPDRPG